MDFWTKLAFFLLIGYSVSGRAFAYVGIPPLKIFIGEVALLAFLAFKPRAVFDRWHHSLTRGGPLGPVCWLLLFNLLYGFSELISGILQGYPPLTAVENLVFNIYTLYLFLGIWAGQQKPDLLQKLIRFYAWFVTLYGPLYLIIFDKVKWKLPGTDAEIFGQAGGGAVVLLGILCYEKRPSKYWLPMTVGAFMLLAMQIRAEWMGFLMAMLVWGVLGKKMQRVMLAFGLIAALLLIGFLADFKVKSKESHAGEISTRQIIGRAISAVNPELARDYAEEAATYSGTVTWRTTWWKAIRESVMVDTPTFLFGHGYGYPLKDLVPYTKHMDIRTPHSIFYFCLGYAGALGVALFFLLQASLAWMLWKTFKLTGQVFGLAFWGMSLLSAFFGNSFETPFGAIPFYLIVGAAIAPLASQYFATPEPESKRRVREAEFPELALR